MKTTYKIILSKLCVTTLQFTKYKQHSWLSVCVDIIDFHPWFGQARTRITWLRYLVNTETQLLANRKMSQLGHLLILSVLLALCSATPFCCDLSFECLNNQRATTGSYRIGPFVHITERNRCSLEGRANWCLAKWTNNAWYCTTPGNFINYLDGYKSKCPGGIFPKPGKKVPCCKYEANVEAQCQTALSMLKAMKCNWSWSLENF